MFEELRNYKLIQLERICEGLRKTFQERNKKIKSTPTKDMTVAMELSFNEGLITAYQTVVDKIEDLKKEN